MVVRPNAHDQLRLERPAAGPSIAIPNAQSSPRPGRRAPGRRHVGGVTCLCSFGVALGRFDRFNSWDIVRHPLSLATGIAYELFHPMHYPTLFAPRLCCSFSSPWRMCRCGPSLSASGMTNRCNTGSHRIRLSRSSCSKCDQIRSDVSLVASSRCVQSSCRNRVNSGEIARIAWMRSMVTALVGTSSPAYRRRCSDVTIASNASSGVSGGEAAQHDNAILL